MPPNIFWATEKLDEARNCCWLEQLPCVKPHFHASHSVRRSGCSSASIQRPSHPLGQQPLLPLWGLILSPGWEFLVEAGLWFRGYQTSLVLGPQWDSSLPGIMILGKQGDTRMGWFSLTAEAPERLLIIGCLHYQGCYASCSSQGLVLAFLLVLRAALILLMHFP